MSYSCCDFVDSILDALAIEVPLESSDSPSDQADLALAEIDALKRKAAAFDQMKQERDQWRNAYATATRPAPGQE